MKDSERLYYQLRTHDYGYRRHVEHALTLLSAFAHKAMRPYLSLSFGKDSVVALHLALQVFPDLTAIYVNCGEFDEWPDTPRVKAELQRRLNFRLLEVPGESVIEAFRRVGYFYLPPAQTAAERASDRRYTQSFVNAIRAAAIQIAADGCIMGLRADESAARTALFTYRAPIYRRREGDSEMWVCCPIYDWTADDVWTYHIEHGLPYNELYDVQLIGRERLRNGAMFGGAGAGRGALRIVRQLYPDLFNRFAAEFPDVKRFI